MELSTFITETLKDIVKGIADSQAFALENGARVNPHRPGPTGRNIEYESEKGSREVTMITFDIAVTASSQEENGLSGGITVLGMNIGGKHSEKDANQTVSRIKFDIGVTLPSVKP
jgi:hypothetical protein